MASLKPLDPDNTLCESSSLKSSISSSDKTTTNSSRVGEALSLRLKTIQSYYFDSKSVWDIGCDHGQLGLSLANQDRVENIYLIDPSELVIETLFKKNIDAYITRRSLKISIVKSKGQDLKLTSSTHTLFISGMGGQEIKEIIESLEPQLALEDRVVISPHRNILELRSYLNKSAFGLIDEIVVFEDGQFYQILCLGLNPVLPAVHPYGEKIWRSKTGEDYRNQQVLSFTPHRNGQSQAYVEYLLAVHP